jgi:outer membrane protein assembly factor BamB
VGAERGIYGAALATDDAVYFSSDNGWLFRLNRADGREVWRYDLGDARVPRVLPADNFYDYDHSAPSPVLAEGVLFIGAGDGGFHAVNAADGTRLWRVQSQGKIRTTAALSGANVIFTTLAGHVVMVERATGKEVWRQEGKTPATSSPTVMGDVVISGTRGSVLRALRLDTGAELWRKGHWGSWIEATPVFGDDGLGYVGTSDYRRFTCFDPKNGRVIWRTDVFGWDWDVAALTAKHVYVAVGGTEPYMIKHEGGLLALERASGKIVWRRPMPNPPGAMHWGFASGPVIAGDMLLVGGLDGTLSAFPLE